MDLGGEHGAALGLIAATAAGACWAARRRPGSWVVPFAAALGALIVVSELAWLGHLAATGRWTPATGLPLHICDAATFLAAAALWLRRQALVELTYFWAFAGTLQALLTPDLPGTFPSWLYFQYYAAHGGIVVAAALLVVGLRISPRPGAVPRAFLLTVAFAAVAGGADALFGANYMYLRQPPSVASLLDVMGPWPWYIVSGAALTAAFFLLLYAPFWLLRRRGTVAPPGTAPDIRTLA